MSSAGASPSSDADTFEYLLDGLAGADLQTAKLIVQALRVPEDLAQLRRLAVTHGFLNDRIRAVVWPRLLGLSPASEGGLKLGQISSVARPVSPAAAARSQASGAAERSAESQPSPQQRRNTHASSPSPASSDQPSAPPLPAVSATSTDDAQPLHQPAGAPSEPFPDSTCTCGVHNSTGQEQQAVTNRAPGPRPESGLPGTCGSGGGGERSDGDSGWAAPRRSRGRRHANGLWALRGSSAGGAAATDNASSGGGASGCGGDEEGGSSAQKSKGSDAEGFGGEVGLRERQPGGGGGGSRGGADAGTGAAACANARGAAVGAGDAVVVAPAQRQAARAADSNVGLLCSGCGGMRHRDGSAEIAAAATVMSSTGASGGGDVGASQMDGGGGGVDAGTAGRPGIAHTGPAARRGVDEHAHRAQRGQEWERERDQGEGPRPQQALYEGRCDLRSEHGPRDTDGGNCQGAAGSVEPGAGASDGGGDGDGWGWDWRQYLRWSAQSHRDSDVVEVDVARSLWAFMRGLGDEQRSARRRQLKRLLNAVVAARAGDVYYYQGLHDVASVLLLSMPGGAESTSLRADQLQAAASTGPAASAAAGADVHANDGIAYCASNGTNVAPEDPSDADAAAEPRPSTAADNPAIAVAAARGELLAFGLLRRLATTHLRDATRPSLEPVVQLLGLMPYMVRAADPALARHLAVAGLQPFFALSWLITWWAHELDELSTASRLFDFFLASHPLMPLYVGAVAMRSQRAALLGCDEMPELHSALTNLRLVGAAAAMTAEEDVGGSALCRSSGGGSFGGLGVRSLTGPVLPLEELLRQAELLWRARPPHALVPLRPTRESLPSASPSSLQQQQMLRQRRGAAGTVRRRGGTAGGAEADGAGEADVCLTACVTHAARMEGSPPLWTVSDTVPAEWPEGADGGGAADGRSGALGRVLARASSALGGSGGRSRTALLSVGLLAGVYVAAAVAIGYATFSRAMSGGGRQ